MNIIFSRKGFDSSTGGVASPIFPDGTLLSLPIPRPSSIFYNQLSINGQSIGPIVSDLTRGEILGKDSVHLDPDLRASMYPRMPGWRPLFGQRDKPQSHLSRANVSSGDIFLFFGWFRQVEFVGGKYRYLRGSRDLHVLFGWLQIDQIINMVDESHVVPHWATYHPHVNTDYGKNNVIYVSRHKLNFNGVEEQIPGGGAFEKYRDDLCLTAPGGQKRSLWKLPKWLYPNQNKPPLSHHSNLSRWDLAEDHILVESVHRGQEFILDADWYPEAVPWVRSLITSPA